MRFVFLAPDPDSFISGGNIYNKQIIYSLENLGFPLQRIDIEDLSSFQLIQDDVVIIDSIFLEKWNGRKTNRQVLLVHHLPALDRVNNRSTKKEICLINKFDHFICTGKFTSEYLQSEKISKDRISIIRPAVKEIQGQRLLFSGRINAIMAANWIPRKGMLPFLKAISAHPPPPSSFSLNIYGSKKMNPYYYEQCEDLISSSPALSAIIHIRDEVDRESMKKLYPQYNLYVSTSRMETFGMSVAEARNAGIPVAALNTGNIPNLIVHGKNGYLFDSMEELVHQINLWSAGPSLPWEGLELSNTGSSHTLLEMGKTLRELLLNLSK